jgi:hypothetical protein
MEEEFDETALASRLEWDNPEFDKASWGKGEWLNEPDKVQFITEGYHCIILRSHHGAFCAYIGVDKAHPCYGLSYEGVSNLIMEIIREDFKERMIDWGRRGRPKDKHGLPDFDAGPDWPEPDTEAGKALQDIQVHGGLTYSGLGTNPSYENWLEFSSESNDHFKVARDQAKRFPIGDAARWLQKWGLAEHSYIEFVRIVEQSCICLVPATEEAFSELWWLGFDCAHAGDQMPAIEALLTDRLKGGLQDVYRNLAYVEAECLNLAIQLRAIEEATHDKDSKADCQNPPT